jgi:hypothetical protein
VSAAEDKAAEIRQLLAHGAHHLIADRGDVRWLLAERERLVRRVVTMRDSLEAVRDNTELDGFETRDAVREILRADDKAGAS